MGGAMWKGGRRPRAERDGECSWGRVKPATAVCVCVVRVGSPKHAPSLGHCIDTRFGDFLTRGSRRLRGNSGRKRSWDGRGSKSQRYFRHFFMILEMDGAGAVHGVRS